jgi:hypothetical protein
MRGRLAFQHRRRLEVHDWLARLSQAGTSRGRKRMCADLWEILMAS